MARGAHSAANDDYEVETKRNDSGDELVSTRRQISQPFDTERTLDKLDKNDEYGDRRSAPPTIKDPTLDGEDESYARERYSDEFSGERPTEPPSTFLNPPFDRSEDSGARARPFDPSLPANQTAVLPDERKIERIPATAPMPPPPAAYGPPAPLPMALMATHLAPPHAVNTPQGIVSVSAPPHPMLMQMPSPMPPPSYGYNPAARVLPVGHVSFSGPGAAAMEPPRVQFQRTVPSPVNAPRQPTTRVEGQGQPRLLPGTPFSWLAWFVFGTAFGLFFAFFATGFFSRFTKEEAPQAATTPVVTATAPAALAAAPPPVATVAPVATTVAPVATPAPAPVAPAATTTAVAAAPATAAPAPVARPRHVHRAPTPAPRPPSGGSSDDDGFGPSTRSVAKEKPPADVGDLLNAGLAP